MTDISIVDSVKINLMILLEEKGRGRLNGMIEEGAKLSAAALPSTYSKACHIIDRYYNFISDYERTEILQSIFYTISTDTEYEY